MSCAGSLGKGRVLARLGWAGARGCHKRRDARSIRYAGRVGSPAAALFSRRGTGNVAWADHHGKAQLIRTALVLESFHIADRDCHFLTRKDIRHGLSKDIRALLLEKSGHMPPCAGRLVNRLRLFAWFDLRLDDAFPDR